MCCEHLVCASCAGPVAAGGCSVCRTARSELHGTAGVPLPVIAAAVTLLLALAVLLGTH